MCGRLPDAACPARRVGAGDPGDVSYDARNRPEPSLCAIIRGVRRASDADPITFADLEALARDRFGDMVKGVVDLRRGVLVLDADMHSDQEAELLAEGSAQVDLWGINLYPAVEGPDWLEFDSMINLRPSFGNRSRGVDDAATRAAIAALVARVVRR